MLTFEKIRWQKSIINTHKRTLSGIDGGYQLDHIISIKFGFDNNISPEALSEKSNLRMLPWKKNLERNWVKNTF
jgi:hypothetical protein